ncbi:Nitrilase and fragile histidine triad fusion protein NitFhit [Taenia crassiceps]|uniref:Nitrilase and fragile histidine triad fusion protein NitFhit n=1 Tax=Taenia crassiceps TaxID=6207 RepID=A0ABR4Q053_9CEST
MSTDVFAVVQLGSTNEKGKNLDKVVYLVTEAAEKGAKMVFLPESADFIGTSREETLSLAEDLNGTFFTTISKLAKQFNIWVSIGSMHRKPDSQSKDQRLLNTHIVLNGKGEIVGIYDKTHLFSIDLNCSSSSNENGPRRMSFQESRYMQPGLNAPVVVYGTPVGNLGLAICYDLRFPELASALRYRGGANVLAYPSAFTSTTGSAGHWHTLLRARAIENQCYVIAAAQSAVHSPKLTTFGHSMVVDPSGQIIAEMTESGPGLLFAQLHHHPSPLCGVGEDVTNYTDRVRAVLPVEDSRRHDLFPLPDAGMPISIGTDDLHFGPFVIKPGQIFYRTSVSMAFVNISPLVPGHVLVTPIEDGKDAGQSVPHVHIHVLPRKLGDFSKNDDIYDALEKHDKVANRKYRSYEEMAEEAKLFRTFFYDEEGRPLKDGQ